ncbi:MAG: tyrosine-type recombinase/integrase [Sulfurimonadaceae bacterium]|nr:tyrosine-type recombinase/integrase [Sulfurimonadaceae bacterium]
MKKSISSYRLDFLESLEKIQGYSDLTIKSYDETLQEALRYVEISEEDDFTLINLTPYRIYMAHLNPKTISRKLSALRSFVTYLNDNGIKVSLRADAPIKVAKTLPKPIAHHHILEALSHADEEESLVVVLLYTLGLRISELCGLELHSISDGWVRVIGKGSKQRDVPLLGTTRELLKKYLVIKTPKKFLFEKNGEKLSENSLRYTVNKVFARVSLKVTPHQLRHSYATALLNKGAPIADVSELLGHASMATTQIYTKLGSVLKQQNYNKAHPLCKGEREC